MIKISVIPNPTKDSGLTVTKKLIELLSGKAEIYMPDGYITEPGVILFRKMKYTNSPISLL